MSAIAHFVAITCYIGAAALAATPFARPVGAPVRGVAAVLGIGIVAHAVALMAYVHRVGQFPLTGLGPALSFAGFMLAVPLLIRELVARDVSLTRVAATLAAVPVTFANVIGMAPSAAPTGARGLWPVGPTPPDLLRPPGVPPAAAAGRIVPPRPPAPQRPRFGGAFPFLP